MYNAYMCKRFIYHIPQDLDEGLLKAEPLIYCHFASGFICLIIYLHVLQLHVHMYMYTSCVGRCLTCSDLVAISCISCVGRRSMLIAIPLSLVVYRFYNNRPGAT